MMAMEIRLHTKERINNNIVGLNKNKNSPESMIKK